MHNKCDIHSLTLNCENEVINRLWIKGDEGVNTANIA